MANDWTVIHHFKSYEFDSPDRPGTGATMMDMGFVASLDILREKCGLPFIVNSGYRTPAYNATLDGSVDGSAHTLGLAADIQCRTSQQRFAILFHAHQMGFKRIGIDKTFIHLDMDASKPQLVAWMY